MNVFLWIVQAVLAAMFAMAGLMKSTQPKEKLAPRLPWVEDFSAATVRFIGVVELLGAIGLILPAATGIAPILTPVAATGLALIMVLAAATHIRRKEPSGVAFNAVLFALAVVRRLGPVRPVRAGERHAGHRPRRHGQDRPATSSTSSWPPATRSSPWSVARTKLTIRIPA